MRDGRRWSFIPGTRASCLLSLLAGVLLLGQAIWMLSTHEGAAPPLQIVVAVLAAVLIVLAVTGLVSPRLRGR
jgi:hypothetical protein